MCHLATGPNIMNLHPIVRLPDIWRIVQWQRKAVQIYVSINTNQPNTKSDLNPNLTILLKSTPKCPRAGYHDTLRSMRDPHTVMTTWAIESPWPRAFSSLGAQRCVCARVCVCVSVCAASSRVRWVVFCSIYCAFVGGTRYAETWDFAVTSSSFLQFDIAMGCSGTLSTSYSVQVKTLKAGTASIAQRLLFNWH